MLILGISAFFHDAAAAVILDGEIIAAAQEERFTRVKNDASFPIHAIRFCLEYIQAGIDDLDAVAFYDKPLLKFERILESYHETAPSGILSFLTSMPVWIRQKMLLKKVIREELASIHPYDRKKLKLLFPEHHLSHAASAFYVSPFKEAAIITIDGAGEWATTSLSKGDGRDITVLREIRFPHSLGLLYSAFTYYCGFTVNSGEYKLMGLAPYGNGLSDQFHQFKKIIAETLCTLHEDGSFVLDQEYFDYISGLKMVNEKKWEALFGFPRRQPESAIEQHHCDLALAIQKITEEIVLRLAATARTITGMENVCLAGGVALNCVANGKLLESGLFKNIYIQPAAGDAGGALGAALAAYHIYFEKPRDLDPGDAPDPGGVADSNLNANTLHADKMKNAYLGPSFTPEQIRKTCLVNKASFREYEDMSALIALVSNALQQGMIVGWFQDRMEFGPRALGNRSILADARNPAMQQKLNLSIKYRESFRPFAPACTIEQAKEYFDLEAPSPYMLLTRRLNQGLCRELPAGYPAFPMKEKLDVMRSKFPSITHVDFSCRVQTVSRESNPKFWQLLNHFRSLTGDGILINTSFNIRGEPIACKPDEAYRCFMQTEMDILVMNNFLLFKKDQQAPAGKPINTITD